MNNEKTAIFIDGANLYNTARALNFDIDYKRLLETFRADGNVIRAYYYTAILEQEDSDVITIKPLLDWLDYNGYQVVTKPAKTQYTNDGVRRVKGNMDIELAVDLMDLAHHVDHIILFSGDGDFRALIERVQRLGVRVTVVSTIESRPPMCADELRRQADVFIDIKNLYAKFGKAPPQRQSVSVLPNTGRLPANRHASGSN